MTRQEIARLVCKSFGLLFAAYAVYFFWASLGTIFFIVRGSDRLEFEPNSYSGAWAVFMTFGVYLSTAAVFWFGAVWIGSRMASQDPSPVTSLTLSTADIISIVFGACGIFIFVDGLSELTSIGASYLYDRFGPERLSFDASSFDWLLRSEYYGRSFWESLVRFAIGLWLILGSRSIVGMFRRMRTWGLDAPDRNKDSGDQS